MKQNKLQILVALFASQMLSKLKKIQTIQETRKYYEHR